MPGNSSRNYPAEVRERAVRMVLEERGEHKTEWAAIRAVSELLGIGTAETVRKWVRQAEIDSGARPGLSTGQSAERKRLKRENAELKRTNAILRAASACFMTVPDQPSLIVRFITEHQGRRDGPDGLRWSVESICAGLAEFGIRIAPSTYYEQRDRQPSRRDVRDEALKPEIARVHRDNHGVYGARMVWLALNREGIKVARCTVERLMRKLGLSGAARGTDVGTSAADRNDPGERGFEMPTGT